MKKLFILAGALAAIITQSSAKADIAIHVLSCTSKTYGFSIRAIMGMPIPGHPGSGARTIGTLYKNNSTVDHDIATVRMKKKGNKAGVLANYVTDAARNPNNGDTLSVVVYDRLKNSQYESVVTRTTEEKTTEYKMNCMFTR